MTHFIQAITTVDSKEAAEKIAEHVLEQKLAACVQISTCESMFWWQGNMEKAGEYVCLMKSREDLFAALEEAIRTVHPYDVPEILATQILFASESYLTWLDSELLNSKTV